MVLDDDVSRQCDFIREDVVITNDAIMRHVRSDHEEVARSDARRLVFAVRAMQRAKLANQIIVANLEKTSLAAKFNVLRLPANHGVLENAVSRADSCKPFDHGIGANLAIWPDFYVIFDDGCRMDLHLLGFEHNGVLWILQILFIMQGVCGFE
ncbi:MAG TPA: hypothetical protein VJS17_09905 [Pyrinomonadaceae bacterium]|nr:hypothetical protein [Pyrinomonadaceae bacterium]